MSHFAHNFGKTASCPRSRAARILGWSLVGIAAAVGFALIFGLAVQWLWNQVMPPVFGVGSISYLQAVGILLLSKLLFGAFRGHHQNKHDHFARFHHSRPHRFPWESGPGEEFSREDYRFYDDFWKKEGREAFEAYLRRRGTRGEEGGDV